MKKTVLITGASSGFGLMLATRLHAQGHHVVGTSRAPEKYAAQMPFQLLRLDIDDDESIASFARELALSTERLDVLVNNAGYMVTGIAEETPIGLGRQQFETNFWGTVKVTNALLPRLRAQRSGQIITVSSIVGLIGPPNLSFYAASKHAVQGYFKSLRFELDQFNIKVNMVEPVWFKTNLGRNAIAAASGEIADYNAYRQQVQAATQKGIDGAGSPEAVIQTISGLIEARAPKFSNPVGKMTGMILFLQNYIPKLFEGLDSQKREDGLTGDTMKFYLCKFIPPRADFLATMSPDEKTWMSEHGAFLNDLLDKGVVVAHGPVIDPAGGYGVSLFRIEEGQDVDSYTSQDPIVKNGVGHYEHFKMLSLKSRP